MKTCLHITNYAIRQINVNPSILDNHMYQYIMSVEAVNQKVLEGVPFRTAYQEVAQEIKAGTYKSPEKVEHFHEGSLGNLCNPDIEEKMNSLLQKFDYRKILASWAKLLG